MLKQQKHWRRPDGVSADGEPYAQHILLGGAG